MAHPSIDYVSDHPGSSIFPSASGKMRRRSACLGNSLTARSLVWGWSMFILRYYEQIHRLRPSFLFFPIIPLNSCDTYLHYFSFQRFLYLSTAVRTKFKKVVRDVVVHGERSTHKAEHNFFRRHTEAHRLLIYQIRTEGDTNARVG